MHELLVVAAIFSGVTVAVGVVSPGVIWAAVSLGVAWAKRVLWPDIFKRWVVEDSSSDVLFIAALSRGIALAVSVVPPVVMVPVRDTSSGILEAAVAALL